MARTMVLPVPISKTDDNAERAVSPRRRRVAVIGAGPAGLMAAEQLAAVDGNAPTHHDITIYDAMPSAGRKFLMAGVGGMNITHSEPLNDFLARYLSGAAQPCRALDASILDFPPEALRTWVHGLGVSTFVGTSGRVFPHEMKAAPMLRTWMHRLKQSGVHFKMRHRWQAQALRRTSDAPHWHIAFDTPEGTIDVHADVVIFAMGGASWPNLGSDGLWVEALRHHGIPVVPFRAANAGFDTDWSAFFQERFSGEPLKNIAMCVMPPADDRLAPTYSAAPAFRAGECLLTKTGIEGGLIYSLSASIREIIALDGSATVCIDLLPSHTFDRVLECVSRPRGRRSLGSHLQSALSLGGAKSALLYECLPKDALQDPARLAQAIKALPLRLLRTRPIAEAISSAGGISFDALDEKLMVRSHPGLFCAGEMIDWEAPTGGYLLTACFATGRRAGMGARQYLENA